MAKEKVIVYSSMNTSARESICGFEDPFDFVSFISDMNKEVLATIYTNTSGDIKDMLRMYTYNEALELYHTWYYSPKKR